MEKIPLIRVIQKKEEFYLSKMKVRDLKKYTVLNFRYPYIESLNNKDKETFLSYLNELETMNLNVVYGEERIQRALNIKKIKQLSKFINDNNNFLPNAIILGCFIKDEFANDNKSDLLECINEEQGIFSLKLNNNIELTAVDGQHRLAGLFVSDNKEIDELEIPIVLLFDISLTVSSKIFLDINSNQKSVDKSLMYDLLPVLDNENKTNRLKQFEIESLERCHQICVTLYKTEISPFYKQIRMLGTGEGAISQAFFVDQIYPLISKGCLKDFNLEMQANILFVYFEAIRDTFPSDWPVLKENPKDENHIKKILKEKKSQLAKTLGVGAFLKILTEVLQDITNNQMESLNNLDTEVLYKIFKEKFNNLKGKVLWNEQDYIRCRKEFENGELIKMPHYVTGTNKVAIGNLAKILKEILRLN
ncbi:MAG: DGQHR domain-containing protein [Bacillota bacterium]